MIDSVLRSCKAEPRDYQIRLATKAYDYFTSGINSVLITAPTGSGKTCVALMAIKALQQKFGIGVGWVAMRRHLLHQVENENKKLSIGVEGMRTISMFERNIPTTDLNGEPIGLLVVDECQHDPVQTMANIHSTIKPSIILGMSATPFRTDRIKLSFTKIIRDIGIHQLIQLGYLSPYHHYTIPNWSPSEVAATYMREPERWGKSVIYFHTREEAETCREILITGGIKSATIYGTTPRRERILQEFEQGELQVLINLFILTEGYDFPALQTCFVRDSQKLPSIQAAGRVFRKHPGIPYKQIVQSKLTKYPIPREATPAEAYIWMDNSWRSYKRSKTIDTVSGRMVITLARIRVELPGIIKEAEKRNRNRQHNEF